MKKFLVLLLTAIICISFVGCIEDTEYDENLPVYDNNTSPSIRDQVESNNEQLYNILNGNSGSSNSNNTPSSNGHVHKFSSPTCTDWGKCACGVVSFEQKILGHDYSDATCTSPKICSRCKKESGKALGHLYIAGKCTRCGIKNNTTSGSTSSGSSTNNTHVHSYAAATCTTPKKCSCGITSGTALGHNFENGVCTRCRKSNRVYLIEDIDYLSEDGVRHLCDRITDNNGIEYAGHYYFYDNDLLSSPEYIEFQTNGNYSKFNGTIFLTYEDRGTDKTSYVNIYGDGKPLYLSQNITKLHKAENFSINIKNISVLKIEFTGLSYSSGYLTNAYLTK